MSRWRSAHGSRKVLVQPAQQGLGTSHRARLFSVQQRRDGRSGFLWAVLLAYRHERIHERHPGPSNSINLALMPQNPYTDITTTSLTTLFPGGVLPPRNQVLSTANSTLPAVAPYPYVSTNKDGEIDQWQLGIEGSFRSNNVLEVGYIGSHAEHGQHRVDYNQSRVDLPGQLTPVASRAPYPSLGVFTSNVHDAVTIYNAGYVRAERRFSHGYSLVASYTFAKTMDNSGNADPPPQNTWNPKAEWGLSLFDTRHRFTLGYVWNLPLGRGQQFASQVNRVTDKNSSAAGRSRGSPRFRPDHPSISFLAASTTAIRVNISSRLAQNRWAR